MQKIAILYDASQAVLSTFDLDEVLNRILGIARDYFRLQNGAILLLDKETNVLVVRASFGRLEDGAAVKDVTMEQGLTGAAARLKRPIYAPDVSKDARYIPDNPYTRSEFAIPLMVRDEVVGVLDCQSGELNHFDSETMDLLTLFATQASIGLQNAHLYSMEQRRGAQLEAINAIAKQATGVLDMQELLNKVCTLLLQNFPLDHVAIFLRDDESNLVLRSHEGKLTPLISEGDSLPPDALCTARALKSGMTTIEVMREDSLGHCFKETRSEICLPLVSFNDKIGLLACHSATPHAFLPNDVQALESVADIISAAIQNAHYVETVRQLAYRDGLTGLFNRRYFDMRILEEMERAARYAGGLSVLVIDIDHFKQVNDEFGHLLGDEVLRQVASIFTLQLRKVDIICRYGGEEFAIVVPATSGTNAIAVAEKLRKVVGGWHFAGVPREVTISIGVADYPEHGTTRDGLVRAADAALYLAKQRGRNRVQSASMKEFTTTQGA